MSTSIDVTVDTEPLAAACEAGAFRLSAAAFGAGAFGTSAAAFGAGAFGASAAAFGAGAFAASAAAFGAGAFGSSAAAFGAGAFAGGVFIGGCPWTSLALGFGPGFGSRGGVRIPEAVHLGGGIINASNPIGSSTALSLGLTFEEVAPVAAVGLSPDMVSGLASLGEKHP